MKEWELRYLHTKAVRDTHCESLGIEIPEDPGYGILTRVPQLNRAWIGDKFWALFNKTDHTSLLFERCACHPNNRRS